MYRSDQLSAQYWVQLAGSGQLVGGVHLATRAVALCVEVGLKCVVRSILAVFNLLLIFSDTNWLDCFVLGAMLCSPYSSKPGIKLTQLCWMLSMGVCSHNHSDQFQLKHLNRLSTHVMPQYRSF